MFNSEELLDSLRTTAYPYAAMETAYAHRDAVTEGLIERLTRTADDDLFEGFEHILQIILLTRFREPRAHAPILALAARDEALDILGDFSTEYLPAALWHTSGGDISGIKGLLENEEAYHFNRSGAARSLVIGLHYGELDEATITDYLIERIDCCQNDFLTILLISNLLDLYPEPHFDTIRARIERDDLDAAFFNLEYFDRFVQQGPEPAADRLHESLMRFGDIPLHALEDWPLWQDPTSVRRTIGGKISLGRRGRQQSKKKRKR